MGSNEHQPVRGGCETLDECEALRERKWEEVKLNRD